MLIKRIFIEKFRYYGKNEQSNGRLSYVNDSVAGRW